MLRQREPKQCWVFSLLWDFFEDGSRKVSKFFQWFRMGNLWRRWKIYDKSGRLLRPSCCYGITNECSLCNSNIPKRNNELIFFSMGVCVCVIRLKRFKWGWKDNPFFVFVIFGESIFCAIISVGRSYITAFFQNNSVTGRRINTVVIKHSSSRRIGSQFDYFSSESSQVFAKHTNQTLLKQIKFSIFEKFVLSAASTRKAISCCLGTKIVCVVYASQRSQTFSLLVVNNCTRILQIELESQFVSHTISLKFIKTHHHKMLSETL